MTYSTYRSVMCVGAGGGLVYYVALFFHFLGSKVVGFDQSKNKRTDELEKLGIKVTRANPYAGIDYKADLVIYTSSIQNDFLQDFRLRNPQALFMEVGEFTAKLMENFDDKVLTRKEKSAFVDSNIAPLYRLDLLGIPVVGVTGTDGKTTTCEMLYHVLKESGYLPAVVTTVSAKCGDVEMDTGFHTTTPSTQELYVLIEKFKELGCTHIILEITSHALAMGRLAGLSIDVAVFTNVTQDHFDYHKNWENYIYAKSLLVTKNLKNTGTVVLNKEDEKSTQYLLKLINREQRVVSLSAEDTIVENGQIRFSTLNTPVTLNMLGEYNVGNALGALGACSVLNLKTSFTEICTHLASFGGVTGRMQVLQEKPFTVIVDFAHTPNALEKALISARSLVCGESGKVIVVFGCAGNRDSSKRSLMGATAKKYADFTVLTAEDPRMEDIIKINSQIKEGWENERGVGRELTSIDIDGVANRRTALKRAIEIARSGDVVIFCGKGHEKSLCFGKIEYPWNDVEEVNKLLAG